MTQERWVLMDDKKGVVKKRVEIGEERRDKRHNERSVGETAACHSNLLFLLFHFSAISE